MDWLNETIFIITTGTNSDSSELHEQTIPQMWISFWISKKAAMGGVIVLLLGTGSISVPIHNLIQNTDFSWNIPVVRDYEGTTKLLN